MDAKQLIRNSKFLSLILRHEPQKVGLTLDPAGWVSIDDLLAALARHDHPLTREQLHHIVDTSEKKRFAFSEDGQRIRASQGHSVDVELGYSPATPPQLLYHGTVAQFLDSIREQGLSKQSRHHVHLSPDTQTASKVSQRRGQPIILTIRAAEMHRDGFIFYLSANNVWLTDHVPPKYIDFPTNSSAR